MNNRCYHHGHIFHERLTVDDVSRKLTVVKNCKKLNTKRARANRQQKQWHLQTANKNSNKCIPTSGATESRKQGGL